MVEEGKKAPEFKVPDQDGKTVTQKDFTGKFLVMYFYPKDMTSGCTVQAGEFQAAAAAFKKAGAMVVGVSRDSQASHCRFREKEGLGFTLLSDEDGALCEAYGVWVEKSMYGRKYMGIQRDTFLIGPDQKVLKIWRKVKPAGHAKEVLAAIDANSNTK